MNEFDEQEELYNPAAPQYQNRAERQRGIMQQFETEALERDRRRQEYINRYSYNFDLATYDAFSEAVKHAENPEAEMHELIAATSISRLFNVPVDEARANSEYYRNLLYPNAERYEFPKAWNEGARDSFKLGTNGVALDYYGFQLMAAESAGKPVDGILEKMNAIEAENEKLAANMPTGWGNRLLQLGAQMTPYTGMLIGIGALTAFTAGAALPALGIGTALGGVAVGTTAAAIGTSVSAATAAGLGTGSVYASLRKDGVDRGIALPVAILGGIGIGVVNGVLGTVAGALGKTPQAAIEKAAAVAAKNLTLKLGASPYGKALAARLAGILTAWALEGPGEALEEGAETVITEAAHAAAVELHNSRKRDAETKFEEVFNRVTGQWESYFREAMEGENIPRHTAEEIIASTKESVIGGFKGGLLFGVFGAFRNGAAPLAEYKAVKAAARVSESAEEFQERTAGAAVFEGMDEKERTEAQNAIYENERRPLAEMEKGKQAELEETRYFGEDAEAAEYKEAAQDEETGGAALPEAAREKGPEYRENGELKTRDITSEEDGVTSGRYAAVSEDGKVYGEIRYTERDGAVEVEGVRMAEGRENLRPELWAEFNRYYEGAPIGWNPRTDAAKKIKSEMAVKPPEEIRFENTLVNQYHVSREDAPLLTAFMKTAAAAKGLAFRQYSETIGHARSSVAELNAMDENLKPGQYHPAAVIENTTGKIRKYILTTERSNAASLIHEVAHDVFDELDGEAKSAVYNALGIDGAATTEQKERFAEAVEQYFAEGRTPHKELKSLFKKIKDLLKAIYDAAAKAGRLTPQMREALDRVFAKAEITEETGSGSAEDGRRTAQPEKTDTGTSGTEKTRQNADTATESSTEAETKGAGETENAKTIDDTSAPEPERVKAVFEEAADAGRMPYTGEEINAIVREDKIKAELREISGDLEKADRKAELERELSQIDTNSILERHIPEESRMDTGWRDRDRKHVLQMWHDAAKEMEREMAAWRNAGGDALYMTESSPVEYLKVQAMNIADGAERGRVIAELDELARIYPPETNGYLAPNGKPSKLTPVQWYQARTPLFKEWFGDWEKLAELTVNSSDATLTKTKEALNRLAGKDLVNIETGITARISANQRSKIISNAAVNKSLGNGFTAQQHNAAAAKIDKLWKYAEKVAEHSDKDNDINIKSIKRFAAPVIFGEETGIAYITVKESVENGHRIYSVELQEIKKPRLKGSTPKERTTATGLNLSIVQKLEKVKGEVSAVRDAETGEPLAVYHGTDAEFDTFDTEKQRQGFFGNGFYFSDKKEGAEYHAGKRNTQGRVMPVFLNIRNPVTEDGTPHNNWKRTNDGRIIKRLAHTEIVVKSPEQIKSATDNAGSFNPGNGSILFQTGYHGGGSTETHGRFSTDYTGDGEGGSKYGWGLYFGSRRETATAYRKALSLVQKTGGGHEYAVELPENEDLADWDRPLSEQPQKIKDKITGLYRYERKDGKFTVYLGGRELNAYDEENSAKTFVEIHSREGQSFGSFYKQLANALGTAKQASLFMKSLDIPGHAYLGEFATAGENQDVPNFVIYDDSALGEPELLFQTEGGLIEDAINSRNAEDFKQYFRTMYGDEDVADIPGARNATDEWLEQFYEAAMRKGKADEAADVTQRSLTREEANEEIVKNLTRDESLTSFLQTIGNYLDSREKNGYEPDMEEGLKYLRHGYWTSGARRVTSKKGSRELKPKMIQSLKTLIKNYPDDIRLAYGHMYGITEYTEAAGKTQRDRLLERARALGDGHYTEQIPTATITALKRIAQEIGNAEIAADVENGTITAGDQRLRDYTAVKKRESEKTKERIDKIEDDIYDFTARTKRLYEKDVKEYENAIKLQERIINAEKSLRASNFLDTTQSGRTAQARLAKERAKTQREYKDLLETYNHALRANKIFAKDAELLMNLRRKKTGAEHELAQAEKDLTALENVAAARNALLKNTMRGVNWNTVKVDRGEELIAFQRLVYSALKKDVAAFTGPSRDSLFDAWTKYRTSAEYRQEVDGQIKHQLGRKSFKSEEHYIRAVAARTQTLNALLSKDWESYTRADFNSLYSLLPDEVALRELRLWEAERERAEKIQIDIAYFTGEDGAPAAVISPELENRLRQFVPDTVLTRIKHKPMAEWTFNELLEAAIAADKIYHRGIEERQLDLAVRREMTKAVQNELLETIKTVAGKTGQEAQDILNKYARGATGNEARKNIFGFAWNHVSDRRFFRMMDNYSDGRFTELMHWMEDDAFNSEQRSMRARVDPIEALMKEQKIDPRKLTDYVIERPSYAGDTSKEQFSIENLLFMRAASLDEKSLDAVVYGNFLTNDEKIMMEGLQQMEKQPFMARAYGRFNSVQKEADLFLAKEENRKYLELLKAVQQDYDRNFHKLDALSRRLYNRPVWKVEHYVPLMRQGFGSAQTAAQIKQLLGSAGLDTHIEKGMLTKRITIGAEHQTPVDMRLYNGWLKSVEKTEHLLAYGEAIQRWNDVFKGTGSNPLNTAINNRYGKEAVDYIREYIGYTANPKAQRDSDKLGTLTKLLRGKTAMAYLPLKISGLLFQAASSPFPYFTELGPGKYLGAAVSMMADRGMYDRIREMSPYMRSRKFSPVQDLLSQMREESKGKIDKAAGRLAEFGMDALEAVDTAAVFPGWLVKYNEVIASHELDAKDTGSIPQDIQAEAVRQADDLVRRLQPSVRDLPPVFRSGNTLLKAILQFQSPQAVIMQQIAIDAFMPGAPPELKRANLKHAARIIASFVLCGIATNLMRQGLPDDDGEGKAVLGYIAYGLSGLTDNIPLIGGGVSDSVTGTLTGKWSGTVGRVSPFPVADAAFRTAKNTARAFETGDYLKALHSGLDIAMLCFGLPYSAMNEVIALFKDGELHPEALLGQR